MNARDHEQVVLNAIESQFRTEDPQLIADFMAFSSIAPPIKPLTGWYRAASQGKRRRTNPDRFGFAIELIAVACALVAVLAGIAALLTTPSH
jgi:Protein of unknown function (DUF3040)